MPKHVPTHTIHQAIAFAALVACVGVTTLANGVPSQLRGGIDADKRTVHIALAMQYQGWTYVMPKPKSDSAAWGNQDPRSTWFYGYWINHATGHTSISTPRLNHEADFVGDDKAEPGAWRRGGSPPMPTKLQWLLSSEGGIKPGPDAPDGLPDDNE